MTGNLGPGKGEGNVRAQLFQVGSGGATPIRPRIHDRPFAALPHAIEGDPRLKPVDKATLLSLLFFARGKPTCWPSNESIGGRAGASAATVKRSLKRIEGCGHVTRAKVTPTLANMSGRTITLAWRVDPSYLDALEARPVDQNRTTRAVTDELPGGSNLPQEEDRIVQKEQESRAAEVEERRRPEAADPITPPTAQAEPIEPPPATIIEPTSTADSDLTDGQRQFLDSLTSGQRERFGFANEARKAFILAPFAAGFDPAMARIIAAELPRSLPSPPPTPPATTVEAIERLPGGNPSTIATVTEMLCRDFGTAVDRRLWGALHSLAGQLWRGEVGVEVVLDAHRQSMGPKSKNRGAVFCHALKAQGWRP